MPHPLDPLDTEEIRSAIKLLRASGRIPEDARFADVLLDEPTKPELASGTAPDRRVKFRLVAGPELAAVEAIVSLTNNTVTSVTDVPDVCPTILIEESWHAGEAVRADPRWQEAMRRRGITDFEKVAVDPWPAGRYGAPEEQGRRLGKAISYLREDPLDNQHARPIEGVIALVDLGSAEVLDVVDHGVVPIPQERGRYAASETQPWRDDLRPIEITQPEGPSFTLDGNVLRWQRWSMRVGVDAHEGLVFHDVAYDDPQRGRRTILYRASIPEMVVPYGDPGPMHGWKNAFDASEWGFGKLANSLKLGCDCLGEIRYLDATMANERGRTYIIANAVCIHEEDIGIGWKHIDLGSDSHEVRRARRLVVSSIVTAGNYDYGFFWYFHLDGTIEVEVKLTGIVTTIALNPGERPLHATRLSPELAAPNHQHLFCARLDFDLDGTANSVYEVDVEREPGGDANPYGNAFVTRPRLLERELDARRDVDVARGRSWKIVNSSVTNRAGDPVGYRLVPGAAPTLLAAPESSIGRRAGFACHNLWVTPYDATERWPAGDYPNQHPGGAGLPSWTAANRPIADTDIVVWFTFGVTHIVRPEEWPIMPVERTGFSLVPSGFFDTNPALDLPPPSHC